MSEKRDDSFETPDALNPEWDSYASAWAVDAADFANPVEAAKFLERRKRIFVAAQTLGLDKELLSPFAPNKPGFEERIEDAFGKLAQVASMAAE